MEALDGIVRTLEVTAVNSEDRFPGRESKVLNLSAAKLKEAGDDLNLVCRALELSERQVLLFAAIMELGGGSDVGSQQLASYFDVSFIRFMSYHPDIQELLDRWLVDVSSRGHSGDFYSINADALDSIVRTGAYRRPETAGLGTIAILRRIGKLLERRDDGALDDERLVRQLDSLVESNPDTSVSAAFRKYSVGRLHRPERITFYVMCSRYFDCQDDMIGWHNIEDYVSESDMDTLRSLYVHEALRMQTKGLITYASESGVIDKTYFKIKDSIKEEIFADSGGIQQKRSPLQGMIACNGIVKKELFYEDEDGKRVSELKALLMDKGYRRICTALKKNGMRTGLTCLFYGAPGTGKTETVYQLAKACRRDIYSVDVTKLRDCYVGESEKNVKALFDNYRQAVKNSKVAPILLFNEADAIFGIRPEGARSGVDKMENSVQNIILQEMENLEGILIATTNLTDNLDKAFERRFLYKLKFNRPSERTMSKIWLSMIPDLTQEQADRLASSFSFSGGQIENVTRKRLMHSIISGSVPDFGTLEAWCRDEKIGDVSARRKVGF